jgi:hypothetical protein
MNEIWIAVVIVYEEMCENADDSIDSAMQTEGRTQKRGSMDDNADLDETKDEHLDPESRKIELMEEESHCGVETRSIKVLLT